MIFIIKCRILGMPELHRDLNFQKFLWKNHKGRNKFIKFNANKNYIVIRTRSYVFSTFTFVNVHQIVCKQDFILRLVVCSLVLVLIVLVDKNSYLFFSTVDTLIKILDLSLKPSPLTFFYSLLLLQVAFESLLTGATFSPPSNNPGHCHQINLLKATI